MQYDHNGVPMSKRRHVESINQRRTSSSNGESVRRYKCSETNLIGSLQRANGRRKYVMNSCLLMLLHVEVQMEGRAERCVIVKCLTSICKNSKGVIKSVMSPPCIALGLNISSLASLHMLSLGSRTMC
jgi:hypothetical protein